MHAVEIIEKKRDGKALSREEIRFFITGLTSGAIPDYQVSAWAMAVLLRGMDARETADLTLAMADSGETLDLGAFGGIVVDKHSTGGVGDKTTLVVEPLVAACGLTVGKMSGRGLGFSGGTLDKMESIPGYRTDLSTEEFLDHLSRYGLVLTGQSADLAPADGKLYALRDVTGTVPAIPLIASSIMSKKIAAGAQAILLDVKVGKGAFMRSLGEARKLAKAMQAIGEHSGRRVIALLSDMNQPLGFAVGNALEVREAIDTLHGGGPVDFREHCLEAAAWLLVLGEKAGTREGGWAMAERALKEGKAWDKFRVLVEVQGGDVRAIDNPERLPQAPLVVPLKAERQGWIGGMDAREIGETAVDLGAGRRVKGAAIDPAVGIVVHCKVGDRVEQGEELLSVHARNQAEADAALGRLSKAVRIARKKTKPLPLFHGVIV